MSDRSSLKDLDFAPSVDFVTRVTTAIGEAALELPLSLHEPYLPKQASEEVIATIESGFVSSVGPAVQEFERKLSEFSGVKHAVSTSSGTAALQLALKISGVGPGDDVAVPAMSFIATSNAVAFLGANPVFVDSVTLGQGSTLGMSIDSLEELLTFYKQTPEGPINKATGSRLAAIVPMHALGRICALASIRELAASWKVAIVEDAAEAIGSFGSDGTHSGDTDIAILSFNGNKTITTGGGGAVLTNSDRFAAAARHLSTTAKIPHPWRFSHDAIGWNFRMPALNASLGVSQMNFLPRILEAKFQLYESYRKAFSGSQFFEFLGNPIGQVPNNWLIPIKLKEPNVDLLGKVLDDASSSGIYSRPVWDLLSDQSPYEQNRAVNLKNARSIRDSIICLPSSPKLGMNL